MVEKKYKMTMSLNVLNNLGITLYGNVPAVISEVVANSWDADAEEVRITVDPDKITIIDDGKGMSFTDINEKYLNIGYQKRLHEPEITPKWERLVMGRKGIGNLSLFSISNLIEIHTKTEDGTQNAFCLDLEKIKKKIESEASGPSKSKELILPALSPDCTGIKEHGTKIVLKKLKKDIAQVPSALKKRLARRFSIFSDEFHFKVFMNDEEIEITDRDYFHKIQYLWTYGNDSVKYQALCKNKSFTEERDCVIKSGDVEYRISGWIGTVEKPKELRDGDDNLNQIVIMARRRLIQEDMVSEFQEGGFYLDYLIGELHADFLDVTKEEDCATSNRQEIIKTDPRYKLLKDWIWRELRYIEGVWSQQRSEEGVKTASRIPAVEKWFKKLPGDYKESAREMFGKINEIKIEDEEQKIDLLKSCVLAFEQYRIKESFQTIDSLTPDDYQVLSKLFIDGNDIAATLYYQIVDERLAIVKALHEKIRANDREKIIQKYLFENLWLLDHTWDPQTSPTPDIELSISDKYKKLHAKLSKEERRGRIDIKYETAAGKHIIVELKRASVSVNSSDLLKQVMKYIKVTDKVLTAARGGNPQIETVCVLGKRPMDWQTPEDVEKGRSALAIYHIKVVLYSELINYAYSSHSAFLEANKKASRITDLINGIDIKFFKRKE